MKKRFERHCNNNRDSPGGSDGKTSPCDAGDPGAIQHIRVYIIYVTHLWRVDLESSYHISFLTLYVMDVN